MACAKGPILPLYIFEPALWNEPDMSYRHYMFLEACLSELDQALAQLGQKLIIQVGHAVDVLEAIRIAHHVDALWSHQETWNGWTYARDKAVRRWCKAQNIPWYEPVQTGVVRCLNNRDGWAAHWYNQMQQPLIPCPQELKAIAITSSILPTPAALGLHQDNATNLQKGGRSEGLALLHSFLHERGEGYTKEMSSPLTASTSCSRISTHLAFGTLSMREVFQACERCKHEVTQMSSALKGKWPSALRSFSGRLRWHCHFIQKLEDDPFIEFQNMHPAYNGLRESNFNEDYFEAWKTGKTGYPMVDACMRSLIATGWLNFRMRAMLMSFASYHLWLHWRRPALYLANLFTDYEPGIHYSQVQMQAGTTGINTIRIYNPIKQGIDQDPNGIFIRQWIPELRDMDKAFIHTPWHMPVKMNGYPMPIIEENSARKAAADTIYAIRKNAISYAETTQKILIKHGSCRKSNPQKKKK